MLTQLKDPSTCPGMISLADGFYQIFLAADNALRLAIMMPCYDGETQLIAAPMSLTMGWTNLPLTFSTVSKTATNFSNAQLHCKQT